MSRAERAPKPENRRASPEAVAKRRAARAFNEVVLGLGTRGPDGRTERKRKRLLQELAEGRTAAGQPLKPIDVLLHAEELLDLGETLATLEEARPVPEPLEETDELTERVRALHAAYGLRREVYRFVGIGDATLARAGIDVPKRGPVKAPSHPPMPLRRGAA
ncbi:MAG: hypothetical protein U0441_19910 [Polyangiaceae bacterium]